MQHFSQFAHYYRGGERDIVFNLPELSLFQIGRSIHLPNKGHVIHRLIVVKRQQQKIQEELSVQQEMTDQH